MARLTFPIWALALPTSQQNSISDTRQVFRHSSNNPQNKRISSMLDKICDQFFPLSDQQSFFDVSRLSSVCIDWHASLKQSFNYKILHALKNTTTLTRNVFSSLSLPEQHHLLSTMPTVRRNNHIIPYMTTWEMLAREKFSVGCDPLNIRKATIKMARQTFTQAVDACQRINRVSNVENDRTKHATQMFLLLRELSPIFRPTQPISLVTLLSHHIKPKDFVPNWKFTVAAVIAGVAYKGFWGGVGGIGAAIACKAIHALKLKR